MSVETKVSKGPHGWFARTHMPYNDAHVLEFFTMKRFSGELVTDAKVCEVTEHSIIYAPFSDYSEHVIRESPNRVTEKQIRDQHARALAQYEDVKTRAHNWYKEKK